MPPRVFRLSKFVRVVAQGVVGFCAVMCVVLPAVVFFARIVGPDRFRIEGRPGVSAVLYVSAPINVRVIGFGPGTDGNYRFSPQLILLMLATPPTVWFVRKREPPAKAEPLAVGFYWLCAACPVFWLLGTIVVDPQRWLFCLAPVEIGIGVLWGLWQVGRGIANRKPRAQRMLERGLCPRCGYDLRATPARCPECGHRAGLPPLGRA